MDRMISFRRIHKKDEEVKITHWGYVEGPFEGPAFISGWEFVCDEQFSGKIDINGRKIFDGDIVLVRQKGDNKGHAYQVVFSNYSYGLIDANGDGDKYGVYTRKFDLHTDTFEVIGNIHTKHSLTPSHNGR